MKKTLSILGLLVALTMMSFKGNHPAKKLTLKTGTYGVCSCENYSDNPTRVELIINEDNTFQYFDNSNPSKKIDIRGSWILNNNTILLKDYKSDFSIHNKWTIDENEKCLKSRKGLNTTRLCHIKSCK
jgi:hypothetical protein